VLREALLGLLVTRPRHGYELKSGFEALVGGLWPVNIGQIYTTLGRLERDGYVRAEVKAQATAPDRKVYSLTKTGAKELRRWLEDTAVAELPVKDDLFLKLAVCHITGEDPSELLIRHRQELYETLADLVRLRADAEDDRLTSLLLDGLILQLQARVTWLDECEGAFAQSTS
jgi:DNA-binding PadR family transcriptional regulator